jgi:hypothetical protein
MASYIGIIVSTTLDGSHPEVLGALKALKALGALGAKTARSLRANLKHPIYQLEMVYRVFACGLGAERQDEPVIP